MSNFKFYEVGGCVRDELMGIKSKDIDYTVVVTDELLNITRDPVVIFNLLEIELDNKGYTIWLSTPECYTIRAKFPQNHPKAGITADFVLARKELGYFEGTRIPNVGIGSLYDDLERRDFTVNAIAKDENGEYIDPFKGREHIAMKVLITPLNVDMTFNDDPLRILRAIRFKITKGFHISPEMNRVIKSYDYKNRMGVVSTERIREELYKAFKHDTLITIGTLGEYPKLSAYIFDKTNLWLKPTTEE